MLGGKSSFELVLRIPSRGSNCVKERRKINKDIGYNSKAMFLLDICLICVNFFYVHHILSLYIKIQLKHDHRTKAI